MMEEIRIRKAQTPDAEQICGIEKLCFSEPWSREAFVSEFEENPRAYYLVAETGGKILGYAGLWRIMDEGHITNVAVIPEYRRRGVASAILAALLKETAEMGIMHHTLEVRAGNAEARALYEKFGFSVAGIRKQYYQKEKEDAMIMWRHHKEDTETGA